MKLFHLFILLAGCTSLALVSCNSDSETTAKGGGNAEGKVSKYLSSLDYSYDKILTKEDVLKHVDIADPALIEVTLDDHKAVGSPEYGDCAYEWPSDRPDIKMNPHMPEMPDMNKVRISNLSFEKGDLKSIRSSFETGYRPMSADEIAVIVERMEKAYKDKPAEELETAKRFMEIRGNSKYKHVEGVGDSAYWHPTKVMDLYLGSELIVLVENVKFTVTVKVSNDDQENLEIAKKLAQEVIAKAK